MPQVTDFKDVTVSDLRLAFEQYRSLRRESDLIVQSCTVLSRRLEALRCVIAEYGGSVDSAENQTR